MNETNERMQPEVDAFVKNFTSELDRSTPARAVIDPGSIIRKGRRRRLMSRAALTTVMVGAGCIALAAVLTRNPVTTSVAPPAAASAGPSGQTKVTLIDAARVAYGTDIEYAAGDRPADTNDVTAAVSTGQLTLQASRTAYATCQQYTTRLYLPGGKSIAGSCTETELPDGESASLWVAQGSAEQKGYENIEVKTKSGVWLVVNYAGTSTEGVPNLVEGTLKLAGFACASEGASAAAEKELEWCLPDK